MSSSPRLSVIVASYNSRFTIARCLASLRRQSTGKAFEVIVVDSSTDGTGDMVAEQFPEVKLLRFGERKFPGDARNAGIDAARAGIVASIDADCEAREDWVEQILEAHRDPSVAIGGAIGNANPESYVASAAYLCEFSQWMPGAPRRWLSDMATANLSYKRGVFDKYGRFIEGTYGSDTDFNWRLGRDGHRLLWEPSIVVGHRSIEVLGRFLRHEFNHGRDCGRMRIASQRFSRLRRWVYATCFALIPVKLYTVIAVRCFRCRTYLRDFLRVTPLLLLGLYSWSLGELVAYVRPARGRSTTSEDGRAER
jgi:glycosyltransferase involved in cell wall biosynthesis